MVAVVVYTLHALATHRGDVQVSAPPVTTTTAPAVVAPTVAPAPAVVLRHNACKAG